MKERFNIEIADIQFSIVSDEGEDFVRQIVETVDKRVRDLIINNKRCSKLDAVILCALDYCGERQKAERRIKSLEAQVELLETNMRRLREESESAGDTAAPEKSGDSAEAHDSAPEKSGDSAEAHDSAPGKAEDSAGAHDAAPGKAEDSAETRDAAPEKAEENGHDAVQSKLRMIEELLGKKD